MLNEFFAVTKTSVYVVRAAEEKGQPTPYAKKIVVFGNSPESVGSILKHGKQLGVGDRILALTPDGGARCGHTDKIIGLFRSEVEARQCASLQNLIPADPRWAQETEAVVTALADHPQFVLYDKVCPK